MAIYQAYPRHIKPDKALEAIRKAMRTHAPEFLLERTQAYAAAIGWQERHFIPHPSSWFNAGQFNDDPEDWKSPPPQSLKSKHLGKPGIIPDLGPRGQNFDVMDLDAPEGPSKEDLRSCQATVESGGRKVGETIRANS